MPRTPRMQLEDGWYHVYARGNRRQAVFRDDEDREWFLRRLLKVEDSIAVVHIAHCFMPNHIHLVVGPGVLRVSRLMHRVLGSYAQWFNRRHGTVGHLFQGRFGSRFLESDEDLVSVVRYVHRNPVTAGLARHAESWRWSSHRDYLLERPPAHLERGVRMVLDAVGGGATQARLQFRDQVDSADDRQYQALLSTRDRRPLPVTASDERSGPAGSELSSLRDAARLLEQRYSVPEGTLAGRRRDALATRARGAFCAIAVENLGVDLATVGAYLGRTPSTIWSISRMSRQGRDGGRTKASLGAGAEVPPVSSRE